ncbi:MAG TPA: hypothetical protein VFA50_06635 [Stellaceae bacterium]|nr:hypothetical protein [Stellaceae bacterium]
MKSANDDQLTDKEIAERMERALKRSFKMPPTPHKPLHKESSRRKKSAPRKKGGGHRQG